MDLPTFARKSELFLKSIVRFLTSKRIVLRASVNGGTLMLVLTRLPGQRIHIGDDIVLTVVRVDGGKVRLGIEAPSSMRVLRQELCEIAEPVAALAHSAS
jgi:carbon storage regulator